MEFRNFIESSGENLSDYVDKGKVTLYHFAPISFGGSPKTLLLDPDKFGKNAYTRNDLAISSTKRIFFYLDLKDKERFFQNNPLYSVKVPAHEIYDVINDPLAFKRQLRDKNQGVLRVGELVAKIKRNKNPRFGGIYTKPQGHVVNWFYPIKVSLVHDPLAKKVDEVPENLIKTS